MEKPVLAISVPCYNEEACIPSTLKTLKEVLNNLVSEGLISEKSFLLFTDDGSKDKTWELISNAYKENLCNIKAVRFSRNFGNQAAILAGLEAARRYDVDAVLTIDADLQQDVNKIRDFVIGYNEGYDIVAGVRNDRDEEGFFKKMGAICFYKLINMLGVNMKPNHSEFRLISRNTLKILENYQERNIFLRGLFSELGLDTKYISFDVKQREYGVSKFSMMALYKLAIMGIVSFSTYPLRLVCFMGMLIAGASFLVAVLILIDQLMSVHMFNSIEFFKIWMSFIAGIQILCIGLIGEYVGQILAEVKGRPRYIISKELD